MILKIKSEASDKEISDVKSWLDTNYFPYQILTRYGYSLIAIQKKFSAELADTISRLPAVEDMIDINKEYRLASLSWKKERTTFSVNGNLIGGNAINIVAGPCSVESEEQIFKVAQFLNSVGVKFIRGGAYKPRTSPYSFQGLGKEGLKLIRKAADAFGLSVVTEVIDTSLIDEIAPYADIIQVGSRNMQNFYFLKQLGKVDKPILLKRGMYARIDEWLMAAEYLLTEGQEKIIMCERGVRTFDTTVRNTMDIAAIPLVKELSHLPVWADPSHGTGIRSLVTPLSLASIAAGADGLVLEIHPNPEEALSDGMQSLYLEQFKELLVKANPVAAAVGRVLENAAKSQNENFSNNHKTIEECVE
ncbi:MAG: 3-deoxy-7-phosphoheptulonate synthase [Bacteroidetes bacterium]|nr:3-deoxy-7-phosphoheptulonate synthase [Bacteroidota bacterium]